MKIKKVLECQVRPNGDDRLVANRAHFIQPGDGCIDEMFELIRIAPTRLELETEYVDQGLTIN